MNYKFLAIMPACAIGITNYWPLVKQVSQEVSVEEQRIVSDLMYTRVEKQRQTFQY